MYCLLSVASFAANNTFEIHHVVVGISTSLLYSMAWIYHGLSIHQLKDI